MKDFLTLVMPWLIAVTSMCFSVVMYLVFLRTKDHSNNLLKHWDESIRINQLACQHIRTLEMQLRHAQDQDHSDDGELWKNL